MLKLKTMTNGEKTAIFLLNQHKGFTELEGVYRLNFTSGRTYISELERTLGFKLTREWEKNSGGCGQHYRYTIPNRQTAQILIDYVNAKAKLRGTIGFSQNEAERILSRFE